MRRLLAHPLSGETRTLKITAWIDGAARGNPGPAGYGAFLRLSTGEIIEACGYLGHQTNNVAEYTALLEAMDVAANEGASELEVISDSELLVKQMLGVYRVKHPNLVPLFQKAKVLTRRFSRFSIRHTLRAGNKDADRLANKAVDRANGKSIERHMAEGQALRS